MTSTHRILNADGIWEVAPVASLPLAADLGRRKMDGWRDIPIDTHSCHLAITACGELSDEIERLRRALERARTILGNMAKENPPVIAFGWQRWPISHEPLRADARRLLPDIDAILAESHSSLSALEGEGK